MAITLPGFDPEYFYDKLSNFWDDYEQRDEIATIWGGMSQIVDNEYLQLYEADFSKSLDNIPLWWRYQWVNYEFNNWISNEVLHEHHWFEKTTTLGEKDFDLLGNLIAANDYCHLQHPENSEPDYKIRVLTIILNGVFLTEGVDYELSGTTVHMIEGMEDNWNILIKWVDITTPVPHSHRAFEEELTAPKITWTDAVGDAFEHEGTGGQGPYQFGDKSAPLEFWVNGVKQIRNFQNEPDSVTLNIDTSLQSGDRVYIRWVRTDTDDRHKHFRFTKIIGDNIEQSIRIPFPIDGTLNKHVIYINGAIQTNNIHYTIVGSKKDIINFDEPLSNTDIVEVELYKHEYLYKHEMPSDIHSIPLIQDGIDLPNIISIQYETHELIDGYLYCDFDFSDSWFPELFANDETVKHNFGSSIDFERENSEHYLNSVRGLWFVYWNGPAFKNIEIGAKILLGVPFAPENTKVARLIDIDNGKNIIVEARDGANYDIEEPLKPIVNSGDEIEKFHPFADGVNIFDYITNPEWYKQFPFLYQQWDQFSLSGEPYIGFWDDRNGELDDGGFWDDASPGNISDIDALNKRFFDLIKWFIFIVNVDVSLIDKPEKVSDLRFFLDTIKPAYTKYLLNAELGIKDDKFKKPIDSMSMEISLEPNDPWRYTWDDGGFMDYSLGENYYETMSALQDTINLPFSYNVGLSSLRVYINDVLMTENIDYNEIHSRQIKFISPFIGGESLRVYEDDTTIIPMEKGIAFDEVELTLV